MEYQDAESGLKKWPVATAALGNAYGKAGYRAKAERIARELQELSKERYVTAYGMALVPAGLDKRNPAIALLEQGFREKTRLARLVETLTNGGIRYVMMNAFARWSSE